MKKIAIKLPEKDRKVKEREKERKERIRMWRTTTRVVPDKRYKSSAQQKQEDNQEW